MERGLLLVGVSLLGLYLAARIHSMVTLRAALHALAETQPADATNNPDITSVALPDDSSSTAGQSLWSEERTRAYQRSITRHSGAPLALLRIPRLELEVPVLEGTDPITLNSGVGRIAGTALPGQRGNIGIAGHRDGFFRGLKDIHLGDAIQLIIHQHTDIYVVDEIHITSPSDVSVLQPSMQSQLTLVTCYPFYFVGPAPERYIVRASLKQQQQIPNTTAPNP